MLINSNFRPQTRPQAGQVEAKRLTHSDTVEPMDPQVTPDGSTVIYSAGTSQPLRREMYSVGINGQDQTQLTNREVNLSWQPAISPDGKKVAYVVEKDGHTDLQLMNLDGSENRNLTNTNKGYWDPTWSPDGKTIVTTSRDTRGGNLELVAVAADGSSRTQLTDLGYQTQDPSYAPDGEHIVFGVSPGFGSPVLCSIKPDGSEFHAYATDLVLVGTPVVSPKGHDVVFSGTKGDGRFGIYSQELDSDAPARLLVDTEFGLSPTFAPDGEHIAFLDNGKNGGFQIFEANANGTGVHAVTSEGTNSSPTYGPDGKSLVYLSNKDGRQEIYQKQLDR